MRSTLSWVAILVMAGTGVFCWQRSQIVDLRAQVARQSDALADNERRVQDLSSMLIPAGGGVADAPAGHRVPDRDIASLRADERRIILDQYQDVVAEMNLPQAAASRLQDLLAERVETVLDAEDAALRAGFAEGSAETARAVTLAIAEVNSYIENVVGPEGIRRIDGAPSGVPAGPAEAPQPPAPPVVVSVVVQMQPAPSYEGEAAATAVPDAYAGYPACSYFPSWGVVEWPVARRRAGLHATALRHHGISARFAVK